MKVKMITALATAEMVLSFDEVVELDKKFAEKLIASNMAVLVEEAKEEVEKEATPKKRGRKKKVEE